MRKDWVETTLEQISVGKDGIVDGPFGSNLKTSDYVAKGIDTVPVLTTKNLEGNYDDNNVRFISNAKYQQLKRSKVLPLDILVAKIGSVGKNGIYPKSAPIAMIPANLLKFTVHKDIILQFVYWYINGFEFQNRLRQISTATAQPAFNVTKFRNLSISLPPLPEQRAIVKKIEQLFSDLDATIADLKKAQGQLKIYRQAVLKKAFEGKFTKADITINKRISELAIMNPKIDKETIFDDLECQFIPMKLVEEETNKIHLSETRRYGELQGKSYTYFQNRDLIFAKVTPCMENGKIAVAKGLKNNIAFGSSEFHVIRCDESILPEYLFHFLVQERFRVEAEHAMTGAVGLRRVPKKFIEDYVIPVPSPEQQYAIVREIESRLSVCDAVEQQIKTSLDKAEALRQSILKKAFAGELLSQSELEACHQEPDYEPASVLLEKIKAEKAGTRSKTTKQTEPQVALPPVAAIIKVPADTQAGLIAKVIRLHEHQKQSHLLSQIKCEKLSHLVEAHLQIPLGRQPVKDAAGPDDYPRLKKVEHRAKMMGYFSVEENKTGRTYVSGKNLDAAIHRFESSLSADQNTRINQLLNWFLPFDLEQAEIIATVYAAWNNLIITGNTQPTEVEIVQEARYNWSDRKLTLEESRFYNAIQWMRKKDVNLVPVGYGAYVDFPKKKKYVAGI